MEKDRERVMRHTETECLRDRDRERERGREIYLMTV